MILSKAASTPVVGAVDVVVVVLGFGFCGDADGFCGEGDVCGVADLLTVLGVGVGLGSTVRVRLEGDVVVLLFCANTAAVAKIIETTATDLFIISAPSEYLSETRSASDGVKHSTV